MTKEKELNYYIINPITFEDGGSPIHAFRLAGIVEITESDKISENLLRDHYEQKTNEIFNGKINWAGVRKVDKVKHDAFTDY